MLAATARASVRRAGVAVIAFARVLTLVAAILSFVTCFSRRARVGPADTGVIDARFAAIAERPVVAVGIDQASADVAGDVQNAVSGGSVEAANPDEERLPAGHRDRDLRLPVVASTFIVATGDGRARRTRASVIHSRDRVKIGVAGTDSGSAIARRCVAIPKVSRYAAAIGVVRTGWQRQEIRIS